MLWRIYPLQAGIVNKKNRGRDFLPRFEDAYVLVKYVILYEKYDAINNKYREE